MANITKPTDYAPTEGQPHLSSSIWDNMPIVHNKHNKQVETYMPTVKFHENKSGMTDHVPMMILEKDGSINVRKR